MADARAERRQFVRYCFVKLRPEWHHADDDKGSIKIVMTGSASDPLSWQQHASSSSLHRHS